MKKETLVSTSQLLLNYLVRKKENGEDIVEKKLYKDIWHIVDELRGKGVYTSIILHGNREEVRSIDLDDKLWYWIGNRFMEEDNCSGKLIVSDRFWEYFTRERINNEVNARLEPEVKKGLEEVMEEI